MSRPAIDLTRYAFKHHISDFVLYGTWLATGDDESEPALVIIPARLPMKFKPAVVALSSAYKYESPSYVAWASTIFARGMGLNDIMHTVRIGEAISDYLPDLVGMPPEPMEAVVVGEGHIGEGRERTSIQLLDWTPVM
ncbi:hypothetical protein BKM35_22105 [Salmonella enterica]|nr:hypothetical protein [Salmonella enterica]